MGAFSTFNTILYKLELRSHGCPNTSLTPFRDPRRELGLDSISSFTND